MPFVTANEMQFHIQRLGRGEPVVMLHGLNDTLASWYYTSAPVLAATHDVLLYDQRGHGRSERPGSGYSLAAQARDLAALIAEFRTEPVTLVGFSYGALIALKFAVDHAPRVKRLILIEAPAIDQLHQLADAAQQIKVDPSPQTAVSSLPTRSVELAKVLGFTEKPLSSRRARRSHDAARFLMFESTLYQDMAAEPEFTDAELARVDMPVSCIYGDRSHCLPAGERWARRLETQGLRKLPSSGHFVQLEAAPALTEAILQTVSVGAVTEIANESMAF
jgi:pimeloyl-ACP methyl ester carboxylesterase